MNLKGALHARELFLTKPERAWKIRTFKVADIMREHDWISRRSKYWRYIIKSHNNHLFRYNKKVAYSRRTELLLFK
jgi:hypothetical protein